MFVPYTTAQKRLMGVTHLRNIMISSVEAEEIAVVAEDIRRLLRYRHQIGPYVPTTSAFARSTTFVTLRTRTTRTMTALLSGVATVSRSWAAWV